MSALHHTGKILLTTASAMYSFVPPIVDFNRTLVKPRYVGTLSDPNGVPRIFKNVDANLFFFTLALVLLIAGYFMA